MQDPLPQVAIERDALRIRDARLGTAQGPALAQGLARRLLARPEVGSVRLDLRQGVVHVRYAVRPSARAAFLEALAGTLDGSSTGLPVDRMPPWNPETVTTLYRHGALVSTAERLHVARAHLFIGHRDLGHDKAATRRVEALLREVAGIMSAHASKLVRGLDVHFDPARLDAATVLRIAERAIALAVAPPVAPVDFHLANVSVGLAAAEIVLAPLTPLSAGLLVVANLDILRAGGRQLTQGRTGLPLLYTAIIAATLGTGQFLSAALMLWCFRYWEQRYREDLTVDGHGLVEQVMPVHLEDAADEAAAAAAPEVGAQVRVEAGELVPADANVVDGSALVREPPLTAPNAWIRKVAGAQVVAGSLVYEGAITIEVLRTGDDAWCARVGRTFEHATRPSARKLALHEGAERFANGAVAPTMATAGVGLLVGDLATASALLRPDYANGLALAASLGAMHQAGTLLQSGVLVRNPSALQALGSVSMVVIDDHPDLHEPAVEVAGIKPRGTLDAQVLLPHIASAALYLGDERADALVRACLAQGLKPAHMPLVSLEADSVTVDNGGQRITLLGRPAGMERNPPSLRVEIDGVEVARVGFRRSGPPEARATVAALRQAGVDVFLISDCAEADTRKLADALGIQLASGDMNAQTRLRFMEGLRRRGISAALVGDCAGLPLASGAAVSIALDGTLPVDRNPADIVILGRRLRALPGILHSSRQYADRLKSTRRTVLGYNLFCVAGVFVLGFNGLAVVLASNAGTLAVYQRAKRSLRALRARAGPAALPPPTIRRRDAAARAG